MPQQASNGVRTTLSDFRSSAAWARGSWASCSVIELTGGAGLDVRLDRDDRRGDDAGDETSEMPTFASASDTDLNLQRRCTPNPPCVSMC